MKIDRHSQMGRSFKDGQKAGIVKKQTVGCAIEHRSNKAMTRYATFEFSGSGGWIFKGQGGETCETGWMSARRFGQFVIDVSSERGRGGRVKFVEAKRSEREYLQIDGCLIHGRDAAGAEVQQF